MEIICMLACYMYRPEQNNRAYSFWKGVGGGGGRGRGCARKFYMGTLRPEVQTLTSFKCYFCQKRRPFDITSIENDTPFAYLQLHVEHYLFLFGLFKVFESPF